MNGCHFWATSFFVALFFALRTIASVIFSNIPLLFAMDVAYGMSKKEKGIAVFSSVIAYLTLQITMHVYLGLTGTLATENLALVGQGMVLGAHTLKIEDVGGLISGLIAAKVTDRLYRLELPLAFAFFSGKKSVAIISIAAMIPVGLLIPFGLHHVFASMVRFTEAGGTYLIDGEPFIGILPAMNRILFELGPDHAA